MGNNNFTEDDEKKYVEALNFIAKDAKFNTGEPGIGVAYAIQLRNHFAFLQSLIPKISSNILEVKAVHTPENPR